MSDAQNPVKATAMTMAQTGTGQRWRLKQYLEEMETIEKEDGDEEGGKKHRKRKRRSKKQAADVEDQEMEESKLCDGKDSHK